MSDMYLRELSSRLVVVVGYVCFFKAGYLLLQH